MPSSTRRAEGGVPKNAQSFSSWRGLGSGVRLEPERASAPLIEDPCVARELCQGGVPLQPGHDLLGPGVSQRGLGREEVQYGTDPGFVSAERHIVRELGAGHEVLTGPHPAVGGPQGVVRAEHLEDHLLSQDVGPGGGRIRQGRGLSLIVHSREARKEREMKPE